MSKTSAQLNREIAAALHKEAPCKECRGSVHAHARKKSGDGSTKKTKKVDGYDVTIWDYHTQGNARFAAYYDTLPASVVGRGATAASAIAELKRAADAYGKQRHREIEREDWDQHERDKEDALSRGDY